MIQLLVIVILVIGLIRWTLFSSSEKSANYLLISCFVQTLPFGYGLTLFPFVDKEMLGAFGSGIRFEIPTVFALILMILGFTKIKTDSFNIKKNIWFYIFVFFCLISIFNPGNIYPTSSLIPLSFLVQCLFLAKLVDSNFTKQDIFLGIYDGFKIATFLQFAICIGYPVLGIEALSTLFKGDAALLWAEKRAGYTSALGTFGHPAILALFCFQSLIFFLSTYLNGFRKKNTRILIAVNIIIIYLTYSRTSLIVLLAIVVLIFIAFRKGKGIFTTSNIVKFLALFSLMLFILYLTPLSEAFLQSDSEEQFNNRFLHWILGYEIWQAHPIFGVGINSHVYYMGHTALTDPSDGAIELDFFTANPIHNIHVIAFTETGALGLFCWLTFFFSRINKFSRAIKTKYQLNNVFNLTFVGVLITLFLYGFFGWAPLDTPITGTAIFLCYFAEVIPENVTKLLNDNENTLIS